jgi:hypothetical protein
MDDKFRVTQDASGNPVYTHNNEAVSKDIFDQRKQASSDEVNAMRNAITPGIDDDPDMMAMRERASAIAASKKPIKKAKGGTISSASKRGDGIAQRGKTRGKMC